MNPKIADAFNEQINKEMYSAYLYLSMASWFNSVNFSGFENWMKMQAQEEMNHAMKFYHFLTESNSKVIFKALEAPQSEWTSPLEAFEASFKHEKMVTKSIHGLMELAKSEKDYAAEIFLQWFITEQVEEEASVLSIIEKVKMIKESPQGMIMLDHQLGERK